MDWPIVIAMIVVGIIILLIIVKNINIVPQSNAYVIERFGTFYTVWGNGIHVKVPFMDRVARKVSLKEQVVDFEPQSVITKDNVTMNVDSVVYFQVIDPKALTYGVERPIAAIENLCATTLRNIIGSMTLDETLVGRETINAETIKVLDEATNKWGIDITRVEVQNITPPLSIQEAMEKQMKAEREKRAVILAAEGEKQSAITRAEGEKESAILRADAIREERIRTAQGEAEAIAAVAQAQARAIEMINQAQPTKEYLQIRSMEAAEKMADGQATKIVGPSSLQDVTSIATLFKETTR